MSHWNRFASSEVSELEELLRTLTADQNVTYLSSDSNQHNNNYEENKEGSPIGGVLNFTEPSEIKLKLNDSNDHREGFRSNSYPDDNQDMKLEKLESGMNPFLFSSIPDSKSMGRTNLNIVLDLDETLVHSSPDMTSYNKLNLNRNLDLGRRIYRLDMRDVVSTRGRGQITSMWGVIRPHVEEFLIFCFSYFKRVIVWSAGSYGYVHEIVKILFARISQPHAVFTREDCTEMDGNYDKNLNKLFNHSVLGKSLKANNTLIIDDRPVSFNTCRNNGVLIPAYDPAPRVENMKTDDYALLQLKAWFMQERVANSEDIRNLDKNVIFTSNISSLLPSNERSTPIDLSYIYDDTKHKSNNQFDNIDRKMIKVR